jgi:DNA polymerase III delta prime subunit
VAKDVQYDKHPPSLRRKCTEGTRQQIMDELMEWARNDSGPNIYWLCGMAGTGKTTIAYSLCESLEAEGRLGASYFCSRTIDKSRDIRTVFPAIARELALRSCIVPSLLVKVVQDTPDIVLSQPSVQFTRLIRQPLDPNKSCVLAFDAFDEFKTIADARLLLSTLTLSAVDLPNIKFFITSRQVPELEEVFNRAARALFRLHNVEESLVKSDIERYLVERRSEIRTAKGLAERWWTDEQLQFLLDRAGKLFIFASTVCSFLETSDAMECAESLKGLLSTGARRQASEGGQYVALDTLYSQVLNAVQHDRRRKNIYDVLLVVTTALNPLSIPTIADLLKIDEGAVFAAVKRLGAVITVPDTCDTNAPVLPFHASFPDFLHNKFRSNKYYLSEIDANLCMMGLCLDVLDSSPTFKQDICNIGRPSIHISTIQPSPVETISKDLVYSCIYWLAHLQCILDSQPLKEAEASQVMAFFDKHVLHWIECMALLGLLGDSVHLLRQIELSPRVSPSRLESTPIDNI